MKKNLLAVSLAALALTSCKKEDKSCQKTVAGIAGTYSLVKVETGGGGSFSEVTNTFVEPCEKDDKLALNANGTFRYDDSGTKCDPEGAINGNWSIDSNGKLDIGSIGAFIFDDLDIVSYDCSTMVAEGEWGSFGGVDLKIRFTFRK